MAEGTFASGLMSENKTTKPFSIVDITMLEVFCMHMLRHVHLCVPLFYIYRRGLEPPFQGRDKIFIICSLFGTYHNGTLIAMVTTIILIIMKIGKQMGSFH